METLKFKVGDKVRVKSRFINGNVGFFEDWMLEDEVITEEEQQENKNSMETKEMTKQEVMAIHLKEEKPRFDPKSLQDFQKVLYRSSNGDWWRLGFFDTYNEIQEKKFWIIGQDAHPYEQCVPYNEETEHLKGQCLDTPEFYRI